MEIFRLKKKFEIFLFEFFYYYNKKHKNTNLMLFIS